MQTMTALIKRECQEHLLGFGWAPLAVLGLMVLITGLGLAIAGFGTTTINYSSDTYSSERGTDTGHEREEIEITNSLSTLSRFAEYDKWSDTQLDTNMERFRFSVALPFQIIHVLMAVFILLGALYEDRRDRSVLFWKSMPVTDTETVLSKLVAVAWIAPLAYIGAIVAAQIFLMVLVSVLIWSEDLGSVGRLWWHSGMVTGTFELVFGYLVQSLWALPLYGWLLAVSAIAAQTPHAWAVIVPVVLAIIERVAFGTDTITTFIGAHAELSALPSAATMDGGVGLSEQFALLATQQMWMGMVVGAGFLWVAVVFRTRNNDR
jgi:ABC-2 type transport system permease protein